MCLHIFRKYEYVLQTLRRLTRDEPTVSSEGTLLESASATFSRLISVQDLHRSSTPWLTASRNVALTRGGCASWAA